MDEDTKVDALHDPLNERLRVKQTSVLHQVAVDDARVTYPVLLDLRGRQVVLRDLVVDARCAHEVLHHSGGKPDLRHIREFAGRELDVREQVEGAASLLEGLSQRLLLLGSQFLLLLTGRLRSMVLEDRPKGVARRVRGVLAALLRIFALRVLADRLRRLFVAHGCSLRSNLVPICQYPPAYYATG